MTISLLVQTQVIKLDPSTQAFTVTTAGPQGPPGQGAGLNYTQGSANTVWTINHNFGYKPSVQTFTVGGLEVLGEIQHISVNQTTITFNEAVAGTARLI
jgi:hypothetical protein